MNQSTPHPELPDPGASQLNFEQSLAELNAIVHALEEGSLGLDEALQRFETGIALLRRCYQILENAEKRIEILTGIDARGNPVTAPFDATATLDQTGQAAGRRRRAAEPKPAPQTDELCPPEDDTTLF